MNMPNLSSWTVTFSRTPLGGWVWRAEHANGAKLMDPFGLVSLNKETAEKAALRSLVRWEQREEISGYELQERLGRPAMSEVPQKT